MRPCPNIMNSHPLSRFSQAFILRTRNPVIAVCLHISHLSTLFLSHSQSHHTCFIIGPFSMSPSHVSCSLSCRSRFDGSPDMPIECCVSTHHPHSLSHRTPCPLMICFVWHSFISLSLSLSLSPSLHLLQSHLSIIFFSLSSVNFFSYSSPHRPLAMFIASLLLLCSIVPNSYLSNLLKNFTPSSMFHCYWFVLLTTYFIVDCCRRVHPHALPLPPFFST